MLLYRTLCAFLFADFIGIYMPIKTDIQQQVFDLLSRASNVSFVAADLEAGTISNLTPGQNVKAEVMALLPNNRFQVRVGAERFNLDLPVAARLGQTLNMTFVSAEPRSTFAITRQVASTPSVALSDASRLLSLLVSDEQELDPEFRSSLKSISNIIRNSSGSTAVLANLLDEALTYGSMRDVAASTNPILESRQGASSPEGQMARSQSPLATFEINASQLLKNIAQNSRFAIIEASSTPLTQLPFLPGEEINATVVGTLSGGRSLVEIAGTSLEFILPHKVLPGEIIRLTYLSAEPKPSFALSRPSTDTFPPLLSEAGRWLSVLEHSKSGVSDQQAFVLNRLNGVLKNLPSGSPALGLILEDPMTYSRSQQSSSTTPLQDPEIPSESAQFLTKQGNGVLLSDDMAKLLQKIIKGDRLALLEALNQKGAAGSFMPGQLLKGEVLASIGGGRFTVQVAEQILEFLLPKGIRRGDLINLFFISEEPRQTFLMARFGKMSDTKLSDTGRWLSSFLEQTTTTAPPEGTLGLLKTVLAVPSSDAQLLGKILQERLRESGLFYESHLARWFGGAYKLEEILREPQGRLSPRLSNSEKEVIVPTDKLAQAGARTGSLEIMEALFKKIGTSMAHEGIAEQRTLPIVSEQLTALQNGQLIFRGDLFPGQPMEWRVAERESRRNSSGERERSWDSSITINLPHLGAVDAHLAFDGQRISVKLDVERGESVPVFESGRAHLLEQFEGAGLSASEMSIFHAA